MSESLEQARLRRMRQYAPNLLPRPRAALVDDQTIPTTDPSGAPGLSGPPVEDDGAIGAPSSPAQTGVMVALFPDPGKAEALAIEGGEDPADLHLTLAFLGEADAQESTLDALLAVVRTWAAGESPLEGEVSGVGVFTAGPDPVTYASIDLPTLPALRERLIQALVQGGFTPSQVHGYTPHMTLVYDDRRESTVPNCAVDFDEVTVAWGGSRYTIPLSPTALTGDDSIAQGLAVHWTTPGPEDTNPGTDPVAHPTTARFQLTERVPEQALVTAPSTRLAKAFVTEAKHRTVITGPASTFAGGYDKALGTNPHMLWMQGRLVGAEKPNRNNAYWSTGDLQLGHPTVAHGPLNWLHEERHIIGSIAGSKLVNVPAGRDAAADGVLDPADAGAVAEPHIVAASAIWQWVYPDEAWVVQQANDLGQLWYSMECISKDVQCVGDGGCGAQVSYANYMNGLGCPHLNQRSGTRRLVDPTFLGAAVIVPPTRPGWADADARLMTQVASMAEKAFEQAGSPDIPATVWEQMMASVVRYTQD